MTGSDDQWPTLPLDAWADTYATLHRWSQIVGKIRLAQAPWINHSWHVTLYVTSRGLTTSPIPHGTRTFEITFDFLEHKLRIQPSNGGGATLALRPQTVAGFHNELFSKLDDLGAWSLHPRESERTRGSHSICRGFIAQLLRP